MTVKLYCDKINKLKLVLKCFFVPNSRVWKNSENFVSQKGGQTVEKAAEMPNLGGKQLQFLVAEEDALEGGAINIVDTDVWRDSWISSYIPKYQTGLMRTDGFSTFPKTEILKLRQFVAIYNDYLRNKEYDPIWTEYNSDTMTNQEYQQYFNNWVNNPDRFNEGIIRGRRQNSYYTDYRTELLGQDTNDIDPLSTDGQKLINLVEYQKQLAELRSQSENAQKNDWDIIAQIRGSKKLTEGKVQLLSVKTIGLNYQSVVQSAYNINENIEEPFQVLGQEGAYCYTEINVPMFQFHEFNEDGGIHVIAQITAETVFETGFDRIGLNIKPMDMPRPDLVQLKDDVLYEIEKCGTRLNSEEDLTKITGFKRKWSEYFKLPNCIFGDITTGGAYETKYKPEYLSRYIPKELTRYESQRAYQFYEQDDKETGRFEPKKIWKDYTDILINRNQAILNEIEQIKNDENAETVDLYIKGQNQAFWIGQQVLIADMPINGEIASNYTTWGEE